MQQISAAIKEAAIALHEVCVRLPESQIAEAIAAVEDEARRTGLLLFRSYTVTGIHLVARQLGQPARWHLTLAKQSLK